MKEYQFKYLRVNVKPNRMEVTIHREDISHLNKKGREERWTQLDEKYSPEFYTSCYETSEREMPCFEKSIEDLLKNTPGMKDYLLICQPA